MTEKAHAKPPIAVTYEGNGVFRCADAMSAELADAIKIGTRLNGRFTKPVGVEDHRAGQQRKFFAGLNLLHENTDEFPTMKKLRNQMLEDLGFYVAIPQINGTVRKEADSMALDRMDDDDFDRLFELSRAYVLNRWGWDPWDQWVENKEAEAIARAQARERLNRR